MPGVQDEKMSKADVHKIEDKIEAIRECCTLVRDKAFSLHMPSQPGVEKAKAEPKAERETVDFANRTKAQLNLIGNILAEALESLTAFAG